MAYLPSHIFLKKLTKTILVARYPDLATAMNEDERDLRRSALEQIPRHSVASLCANIQAWDKKDPAISKDISGYRRTMADEWRIFLIAYKAAYDVGHAHAPLHLPAEAFARVEAVQKPYAPQRPAAEQCRISADTTP